MDLEEQAYNLLGKFQVDEKEDGTEGSAWTDSCDLIRHLIRIMANHYRYDPEVLALMIIRQQHVT